LLIQPMLCLDAKPLGEHGLLLLEVLQMRRQRVNGGTLGEVHKLRTKRVNIGARQKSAMSAPFLRRRGVAGTRWLCG
jgi:hypothetical protein